ncbi:MAG: radical SAM protein, partial [Endomicrobiaceae bacterium]|nr:radical SAM protein [Endomicrobiaceae bacterium]
KSNKYGCGHYIQQEIEKPRVISNIKRKYHRFGIPADIAKLFFQNIEKPDIIIIGSIMTYWYLGIIEASRLLKKIFPKVPIILSGIYATLCNEHARTIGTIDEVVIGSFDNFVPVLKKYNINIELNSNFERFPVPDYSFYKNKEYIVLKTSIGCPFKCNYCAQYILNNNTYTIKNPLKIKDEIYKLTENNIQNIAFYDDALLFNSDKLIKVLLKELQKDNNKYYFHTPNGLHARFLDQELAELMFNAKFIQPRFSLETSNSQEQKNSNNKVNNSEYERTIKYLNKAGYKQGEYITYLLIGMPGQNIENIKESIKYVHNLGSRISLSEYSPIPYTKDWQTLTDELKQDPLTQNNTFFMTLNKDYDKLIKLKEFAKQLNKKLQT